MDQEIIELPEEWDKLCSKHLQKQCFALKSMNVKIRYILSEMIQLQKQKKIILPDSIDEDNFFDNLQSYMITTTNNIKAYLTKEFSTFTDQIQTYITKLEESEGLMQNILKKLNDTKKKLNNSILSIKDIYKETSLHKEAIDINYKRISKRRSRWEMNKFFNRERLEKEFEINFQNQFESQFDRFKENVKEETFDFISKKFKEIDQSQITEKLSKDIFEILEKIKPIEKFYQDLKGKENEEGLKPNHFSYFFDGPSRVQPNCHTQSMYLYS